MKIVPVYNRWIQQRCCQSKGIWHNFWWQHPHIVQYSTSFVTYVFFIWFFLKIEILPRKKHRQIEWISNNCNIFKFGSHWLSWWYFFFASLVWCSIEFLLQENKNRIYRAKVAPSLSLFPRLYSYKIPFRVPTHTQVPTCR